MFLIFQRLIKIIAIELAFDFELISNFLLNLLAQTSSQSSRFWEE